MEFNKKMSKSGAVTLPAALRRELGIEQGEKLNITVDTQGTLQLKRIQGQCVFCKADEQVITFASRFVCKSCIDQLQEKKGAV